MARRRVMLAAGKKPRLPIAYQEVEYLESTGTQAINTGITPSKEFYVKFDLIKQDDNRNDGIGGARQGDVWGLYCYLTSTNISQSLSRRSACAYGSKNVFTSAIDTVLEGPRYLIEYRLSASRGLQTYINGILQSTNSYSNPTVSIPWYLFANNLNGLVDAGRNSQIRLFSFEMGQGNQTLRDFIPCYRKSDHKTGMFDLVTKTFFTNSGTGEFLVGPDVN